MKKNSLLVTVAALSLFGAAGIAAAQAPNQGGAGGQPPAEAAKPEAPPPAKEPAAKQPAHKQTQTTAPAGTKTTAQETKPSSKQTQGKPASATKQKSATSPADSKASTSGAAPPAGAAAEPPPEKRSEIASAIKQEKIPEAKNVNFDISIGARVPSTVRFYPVPARIVGIYPEWRGYRVILVNGRYVIVRPNTYEIVYVIEG
jgi:uncharacterized protein DUF1236